MGALIRQAISTHQADWDAWVSEINQQGRTAMAIMDEWLVIMAGGAADVEFPHGADIRATFSKLGCPGLGHADRHVTLDGSCPDQ